MGPGAAAMTCHRFVQNAWKKDMCSNCFKGRDEHRVPSPPRRTSPAGGSVAPMVPPPPPVRGILKQEGDAATRAPAKRAVSFGVGPPQVIGHGGDDDDVWSDDGDENDDDLRTEEDPDEKEVTSDEEERRIQQLTRDNTLKNGVTTSDGSDVQECAAPAPTAAEKTSADRRRTFTQLMLGKPQTDEAGNRRTLLVSVVPFEETSRGGGHHQQQVTMAPTALTAPTPPTSKPKISELKVELELPPSTSPCSSPEHSMSMEEESATRRQDCIVGTEGDVFGACTTPTEKQADEITADRQLMEMVLADCEHKISLVAAAEDASLPVPVQSREQAGEPDGRADPPEEPGACGEPPALPRGAPPASTPAPPPPPLPLISPRTSFLHGVTMVAGQTPMSSPPPLPPSTPPPRPPAPPCKMLLVNKRRAPEPPSCPSPTPSLTPSLYTEEKRAPSRGRFSLKRLLRVGGGNGRNVPPVRSQSEDICPLRERLVIVHPLHLESADVQVVSNSKRQSQEVTMPPDCPERVYANLGEVRSELAPSKPHRTASVRSQDPTMRQGKEQEDTDQDEEDEEEFCDDGGGVGGNCQPLHVRSAAVLQSLEDNYDAVVVANHEALVQALEVIERMDRRAARPGTAQLSKALREADMLRWSDFEPFRSGTGEMGAPLVVGQRAFMQAKWRRGAIGSGGWRVTLATGIEHGSLRRAGPHALRPLAEFSDLVPVEALPGTEHPATTVPASVAVLSACRVDTTVTLGTELRTRTDRDAAARDAAIAMLQLVSALKWLQAGGAERTSPAASAAVLCRAEMPVASAARLCLLQGPGEEPHGGGVSLCRCAADGARSLLPPGRLRAAALRLLEREGAVSLSQMRALLEFWLWGPPVAPAVAAPEERALQRWLDLERATALRGLVSLKFGRGNSVAASSPVLERCRLQFLVHTTARAMAEAARHLSQDHRSMD